MKKKKQHWFKLQLLIDKKCKTDNLNRYNITCHYMNKMTIMHVQDRGEIFGNQ